MSKGMAWIWFVQLQKRGAMSQKGFKRHRDNFTSTSGLTSVELVLRSDQGQNAALGCEGDEGSKPAHRLPEYCWHIGSLQQITEVAVCCISAAYPLTALDLCSGCCLVDCWLFLAYQLCEVQEPSDLTILLASRIQLAKRRPHSSESLLLSPYPP